ncbi:MAG: hypothetical protein GQ570_00140 [Helicobacteraceae bacterium]|nr:hypothetical protein [Helicobacteraceae bacterium]
MDAFLSAVSSISVLVFMIVFVVSLRNLGVLKDEDGALFGKIVVTITLPAVEFYSLAHASKIDAEYLILVLIILSVEVFVLTAAWFIGKALKLENRQLGSFMLVSAFSSSAMLGYAFAQQLFPENIAVMTEMVFTSELGVGIGIFTFGTMVAIYFGNKDSKNVTFSESLFTFLKSPLFMALGAGILWSTFDLPTQTPFFKEFFDAVKLVGHANTFFVTLTVGVALQFIGIKDVLLLAIFVVILKLIVSPLLVFIPFQMMQMEVWQYQVIIIETAMPTAMLSVVLASKYGCDVKLASKLLFITTIMSAISIPIILSFHSF